MLSAVNQNVNCNPSFGQVNIVRVSKKAFSNPEDLKACSKEFGKVLDKASGNILGGFDKYLALFGFGRKAKTFHNLEGIKGINIVRLQGKEDEHTFCVLTGAEKDVAAKMSSLSAGIKILKELLKNHGIDNIPNEKAAKDAMIGKYFSDKIRAAINIDNPKEFKIENLQQLIDLKTKLGF